MKRAVLCALLLHSLATMSSAQSYVTLTPESVSLLVGQDARLEVAFDAAVTYDAQISTYCVSKQSSIRLAAVVASGTRTFEMSAHIPTNQAGGLYKCSLVSFSPAPKETEGRVMKAPSVSLNIASALPTSILGSEFAPFLTLKQKQLLTEESDEIRLVTKAYKARMTDARPSLRGNRVQLIDLLSLAEDQEGKLYEKLQENGPSDASGAQHVFFDDLRENLENSKSSLESTLGTLGTSLLARPQSIHTSFLQSVPRDRHSDPETKGLRVLQYAAWVYSKVAGSGDFHFTVTIRSTPKGARVFYKRGANPFEEYPGDTDIDDAPFPYSEHYTFKVDMAGCDPWQRDADLGLNANPKFNAVLNCSRK